MLLNVFPTFAAGPSLSNHLAPNSPTDTSPDAKLGWILMRKHWISESQLQLMLNQQTPEKKLGELLLDNALISAHQLEEALREQYWRRHGYWVIQETQLNLPEPQ